MQPTYAGVSRAGTRLCTTAWVRGRPVDEVSGAAGGCAVPRVARLDDRGGAVGDLELAEDVRHVVAHRLQREHEVVGDHGVALAGGDELEDLPLAVGQGRERRLRRTGPRHEVLH